MKKQRFSTEQIVAVLKQAELGLPVKDLIRQIGISVVVTALLRNLRSGRITQVR